MKVVSQARQDLRKMQEDQRLKDERMKTKIIPCPLLLVITCEILLNSMQLITCKTDSRL